MPPPSSPPPTNEAGAISNPRQLNRWLDVNPVYPLTRTQTYFTFPAFEVSGEWRGYSEIIAVFNYAAPSNFVLKTFAPPDNPNFCACIMWVDSDYGVHRYRLWQNVGEIFFFPAPLYDGQLIKKNFRIEIWSTTEGIDLSTVTVTGAGTGAADGTFAQTAVNIWGNFRVISSIDAYSGDASVSNLLTLYYQTVNGGGIFALMEPVVGIAPVPVVSAGYEASMDADLTFYTSVKGNYDYMWQNDTALVSATPVVTNFAWPTVANVFPLPFLWPADSVPVLND